MSTPSDYKKKNTALPIFVTKSFLPPVDLYLKKIQSIFSLSQLTNNGPLCQELEQKLSTHLGLKHLLVCSSGTMALQLAIRLLNFNGKKIITTPYSYVATVSALLWENCIPIFADIDPLTLCISPASIEKIILEHPDVAGVLPVHVYGRACDVHSIQELCVKYNLTCLYDAAHAFGSVLYNKSLLDYGDISIVSFHATKLFQTVEGGALVFKDKEMYEQAKLLRAFGHKGDDHICLGINAKMSEFHAAMGLCVLPYMEEQRGKRKELATLYNNLLKPIFANGAYILESSENLEWNYAYYPIVFPNEDMVIKVKMELEKNNIFARRYFYPCLTKLPYLAGQSCPIAEDLALRVLALPFYTDLDNSDVLKIANIIIHCMSGLKQ